MGYRAQEMGLTKPVPPLPVGALQGAEAAALVITGEHAVAATHYAGDKLAVDVGVGHALPVDDGLGRRAELGPHLVESVLNSHHFVERDRRTGVALHAALALATLQVAAKLLRDDVGGYKHIANLDNM